MLNKLNLNKLLFNQPTEEQVATLPAASGMTATMPAYTARMRGAATAAVNAEFAAEIEAVLNSNTVFKSFRTQLKLLEAAIPDEGVRINAAAASVSALLNISPPTIKLAVGETQTKLTAALKQFDDELAGQVNTKRQQYSDHISAAERKQAENAATIARLHEESNKLAADVADAQVHLNGINDEAARVRAEFLAVYEPAAIIINSISGRL